MLSSEIPLELFFMDTNFVQISVWYFPKENVMKRYYNGYEFDTIKPFEPRWQYHNKLGCRVEL